VQLDGILLVLSGDIANNGASSEYLIAESFLDEIRLAFWDRYPDIDIKIVAVPGNHDCELPKDEVHQRRIQVEGSLVEFDKPLPDRVVIKHLLDVQKPYWAFSERLGNLAADDYTKIFRSLDLTFNDISMRVNLFNSATLSQRIEDRSKLLVPVPWLTGQIQMATPKGLNISIVHHPMQWLEPNNMLAFRHLLTRTSNFVITGHQHFTAGFLQIQDTGEHIHFYENPPLYDRNETVPSGFRVLSIDLSGPRLRDTVFQFDGSIYRAKGGPAEWNPLQTNVGVRQEFSLHADFANSLSDPGVVYMHPDRPRIGLSDLFVYPDLRPTGKKGRSKPVNGKDVFANLSKSGLHFVQGDAFSGKTALAKSLFTDCYVANKAVPLLLDATGISAKDSASLERQLITAFKSEYHNADVDSYKQLHAGQRMVIIDNWHRAQIAVDHRYSIYSWLRAFAGSCVLFTDKLYDIKQTLSEDRNISSAISLRENASSKFEIIGLSHVGRGDLINRWLNLKKEAAFEPAQSSRESKEIEDEISRLLGIDRLPPYAFFIICLLQARETNAVSHIAGGSFGRLYEVLVTSALNQIGADGSQLERKIALLSEIAAYMWRQDIDSLSYDEVLNVADVYHNNFSVKLRVESLLMELEKGRVITRSGERVSFSYAHFHYYFIALYIKDRIDDSHDNRLVESIGYMIDNISSELNNAVIMFLIYFAKERSRIIHRLIDNASSIYSDVEPAHLGIDIGDYLFRKGPNVFPAVNVDEDIAAKRLESRERRDALLNEHYNIQPPHNDSYVYSNQLSDDKKLHLADRNIDALGQVIRTFSVQLPTEIKIQVLKSAYLLGLRLMKRLMQLGSQWFEEMEERIARGELKIPELAGKSSEEIKKEIDSTMLMIGKIAAIVCLEKISSSVGVADMESAYTDAIGSVLKSNATMLVEIKIQMDHFGAFPTSKILKLDRELKQNPFAQDVLHWLVSSYLMVYRVDRTTRQKMASMLKMPESSILQLSLNEIPKSS